MATIAAWERPTRDFTRVANAWLRDPSIDGLAKGVLCWLASHDAGYIVSVADLVDAGLAGRDAIKRTLRALVDAGYLVREQFRDAAGKLREAAWRLGEPKRIVPLPIDGNPVNGHEQAKQGVCPGQTVDGFSVPRLQSFSSEDHSEEEPQPTRARARLTTGRRVMAGKITKVEGQQPLPGVTRAAMAARTDLLVRELVDTITGEWLERCTKLPPSRIRQQVRAELHALVVDGIDPDDIRRGCARWMATGLPPSQLPANVNAAMNQTAPARRGQLSNVGGQMLSDRTRERLAVVEHFAALEQQAIEGAS